MGALMRGAPFTGSDLVSSPVGEPVRRSVVLDLIRRVRPNTDPPANGIERDHREPHTSFPLIGTRVSRWALPRHDEQVAFAVEQRRKVDVLASITRLVELVCERGAAFDISTPVVVHDAIYSAHLNFNLRPRHFPSIARRAPPMGGPATLDD